MGRSPGEGNGCPLQCSGLDNSMDCVVHGVAEARLSDCPFPGTWGELRGGCFQCPITWSCSALTPADRASAQLQATGQVSRACARAHLPRRKVSQALFDIYFPGFPLRFFGQSPVGPIWPHHPRELQRERTTVLDTVSPGPRAALLRGGFRAAEPSRGRSSSAAGLTASVAPGLL